MDLKRFATLLFMAVLSCTLCACGKSSAPLDSSSASNIPAETTKPETPRASNAAYHTAAESFSKGSGTENDPYQIGTVEELVLFGEVNQEYSEDYNAASYILTADISLNDTSDFSNWSTSEPEYQWKPMIGRFQGIFDGKGHTISGMYVYAVNRQYEGATPQLKM